MISIIAKREFTNIVRSKAMKISTVVTITVMLLAGVATRYFVTNNEESAAPRYLIGVDSTVSDYEDLFDMIVAGMPAVDVEVSSVNATEAETFVLNANKEDNTRAVALTGRPRNLELVQEGSDADNTEIRALVSQVAQLYLVGGENPSETDTVALVNAQLLPATQVGDTSNANLFEDPEKFFPALITISLLMMSVIIGTSVIASGVVEEKQSRVVEILLSSVRPRQLLTGKILGIGAFVIAQFVLIVVALIAALKISGIVPNVDLTLLITWSLAWVVVGFFLYSALTGALASTVSRQEELQAVTMPITFLTLAAFYGAMYLVPAMPEALVTKALSWVPFLANFFMPMRTSLTDVPMWEQLGALAINIVAFIGVAALAGKIYQNSVLRTGQRVKLMEALRG